MLERLDCRQVVQPCDVAPTLDGWEVVSTFNPAAVSFNGTTLLLVRIAERPRAPGTFQAALPRWNGGELTVDWIDPAALEMIDPRVVVLRQTGFKRLTFTSHLRVARFDDTGGDALQWDTRFDPLHEWEEFGVEDPRLTRIGDLFYMTYVAVSRHGAATALASTADFREFTRHGIIFPPENKDVLLFPRRINGRFAALHRPNPSTHFSAPEMWLAWSDDLQSWGGHCHLSTGTAEWESDRIGGGVPPIETREGWLVIYHGSSRSSQPQQVGRYVAGAMLLDLENPSRITARTAQPILVPTMAWEVNGFVPQVVFPTAAIDLGDRLQVYYGAADTSIGVVEWSWQQLLEALKPVSDRTGR